MFSRLIELVFGVDRSALKRGLDQAKADVQKFGRSASKNLKKAFSPLTGAFTFVALTASLGMMSKRVLAYSSNLSAFAKRLGVSTEFLQAWNFAAEQNEISTQGAQQGLQRFMRRLGEARKGYGELLPVLKQYNIELEKGGKFRGALDVLKDLADRLHNAADAEEKLSISTKAFDTEGAGFVNFLDQGSEALDTWMNKAKEAGQVMEDDMIQKLAVAKRELDALNNRFTIFFGNIAGKVLAPETDMQSAMSQARKEMEALRGGDRDAAVREPNFVERRAKEILNERVVARIREEGRKASADEALEKGKAAQAEMIAGKKLAEEKEKLNKKLADIQSQIEAERERRALKAMTTEERLVALAEKRSRLLSRANTDTEKGLKAHLAAEKVLSEMSSLQTQIDKADEKTSLKDRKGSTEFAVSSLARIGGGGLIGPASGAANALLSESLKQTQHLAEIKNALKDNRRASQEVLMK